MTTSVFPVGHYGGPRAAAEEVHVVRVGWQQHQLGPDAFGVWVLSHGLSETGKSAWTSDDIVDRAQQAGLAKAETHLDDLLARGVLAAVPDYRLPDGSVPDGLVPDGPTEPDSATATTAPGGATAVDFARRHRMETLFVGLGNSPDRPDLHAVGVPGIGTAALLDPDSYELWQWGSLAPTLWHGCEVRSSVSDRLGEPLHPLEALHQVLGDLRLLVAHGCAYLDVCLDVAG